MPCCLYHPKAPLYNSSKFPLLFLLNIFIFKYKIKLSPPPRMLDPDFCRGYKSHYFTFFKTFFLPYAKLESCAFSRQYNSTPVLSNAIEHFLGVDSSESPYYRPTSFSTPQNLPYIATVPKVQHTWTSYYKN